MSLISFFFSNIPMGNIGGLTIDATISDSISYNANVTQYPVEEGSFISDNITIQPYTVQIRGLISDSPIFLPGITENSNFLTLNNSRVKNAYEELLSLFVKKEPFTVVTGLDVYSDVFFTSFDISRDSNTGKALSFDAKFQQILFATPAAVKIPKSIVSSTKKDLAQSTVDKGSTQAADAESKRQSQSILYKFFGSQLSGALGVQT
jgi:hypothetical protein